MVEGELIGGNITLLCASIGTPYQPDVEGKVLIIEDVGAEPWIVDNSMSHLRNAGILDKLAVLLSLALLFSFTGCGKSGGKTDDGLHYGGAHESLAAGR